MFTPTLPDAPVDGYVLRWWVIDYQGLPVEARAVYHANTPWRVYRPDDNGRPGADLVDCWMLYPHGGDFCNARASGWQAPTRKDFFDSGDFATRDEAVAFEREVLEEGIARARAEIARFEAGLARLASAADVEAVPAGGEKGQG